MARLTEQAATAGVDLVYCADGNPEFARIAVECGWRYGARLPATVYQPVWFADQDWRRPDLTAYARAVETHKPEVATVLDWEQEAQWPDVANWAETIAPHVKRIVVIPKVPGRVADVPVEIGGRPVVLGYSVPTSYGGTTCALWEFARRPVHLLGGSPHAQLELSRYLNVASADGNMTAQQARQGRFWSRAKTPKGHWVQLQEVGDHRQTGVPAECFRRTLANVQAAWTSYADKRGKYQDQQGLTLPFVPR